MEVTDDRIWMDEVEGLLLVLLLAGFVDELLLLGLKPLATFLSFSSDISDAFSGERLIEFFLLLEEFGTVIFFLFDLFSSMQFKFDSTKIFSSFSVPVCINDTCFV